MTKFVSGEITEAKEILWRISGETILGKMVKCQGAAKSQSEINDICAALKILSEKDCMPIQCPSNMVSQMPIYNLYPVEGDNSEVTARLKIVEESLNSIMTSEKMKINNLQSDPTVRTTTLTDKKEVKQNQLECMSRLVANGDMC